MAQGRCLFLAPSRTPSLSSPSSPSPVPRSPPKPTVAVKRHVLRPVERAVGASEVSLVGSARLAVVPRKLAAVDRGVERVLGERSARVGQHNVWRRDLNAAARQRLRAERRKRTFLDRSALDGKDRRAVLERLATIGRILCADELLGEHGEPRGPGRDRGVCGRHRVVRVEFKVQRRRNGTRRRTSEHRDASGDELTHRESGTMVLSFALTRSCGCFLWRRTGRGGGGILSLSAFEDGGPRAAGRGEGSVEPSG